MSVIHTDAALFPCCCASCPFTPAECWSKGHAGPPDEHGGPCHWNVDANLGQGGLLLPAPGQRVDGGKSCCALIQGRRQESRCSSALRASWSGWSASKAPRATFPQRRAPARSKEWSSCTVERVVRCCPVSLSWFSMGTPETSKMTLRLQISVITNPSIHTIRAHDTEAKPVYISRASAAPP